MNDVRSTLHALDRSVVWHAFSQMAEYDGLIIESAKGCWLTDIDGRAFLDGASSLWCNLHGHRHPHIDAAIMRQLQRVSHVTNLGMSHPTTISLANRLVELAPEGLKHVFFSSDGASAVEVAMKMAFQYWKQIAAPEPKRTQFLAIGNAYHGDTLGTVSVGGVSRFHDLFSPLLFSVLRGPCPDTYRTPKDIPREALGEHYLNFYGEILERHADEIVAVIIEPLVQGAAGMVMHPRGFLKGIEQLCRTYGCLLIADEIAVGIGRTGTMFACEQEQVEPDFLCIGKGLTGGYMAMSATLTTDAVWNAFLGTHEQSRTFFHGHSYGGNPLAAAAAHASLDIFDEESVLGRVAQRSRQLGELLEPLRDKPLVGDVRHCGLMGAVELVRNKASQEPFAWSERVAGRVCQRATERGVWLRPIGNVIPIIPPLSISESELQWLVDTLGEVLT